MGQKKDQAFKSMLQVSGYSSKTADDIWNWYTSPTGKDGIPREEKSYVSDRFVKQKINNPADNTLVRTRKN